MSRGGVRIAFILSSLNELDIIECDIVNAYLNANFREKLWTEAATWFETEKGIVMIIARALYGVRRYGAASRAIPA